MVERVVAGPVLVDQDAGRRGSLATAGHRHRPRAPERYVAGSVGDRSARHKPRPCVNACANPLGVPRLAASGLTTPRWQVLTARTALPLDL